MSDTPKTDDQILVGSNRLDQGCYVRASFARELERENARLQHERMLAQVSAQSHKTSWEIAARENRELRGENARLREALEATAKVFDEMDSVIWEESSDWTRGKYSDAADKARAALSKP